MCKVSHFVVAHFGYIQADYSESSRLECSPKQSNAEKLAYSFEDAILTIWNALRGRGRVGLVGGRYSVWDVYGPGT